MTETLRAEVNQHIKKMDEFQLRLLLGFIKKLSHIPD